MNNGQRQIIAALLNAHDATIGALEQSVQALQLFLTDYVRALTPDEEAHRHGALTSAARTLATNIPELRAAALAARAELHLPRRH